ncbi:MAG: hypothetical protein AMJ61_15200 [Desulfobacterales bacterium SG8_35_2]|nr:MAG: hypothetical protein AMJ61_15200 [Desulfobacterales bacterium SG8_35_2]
MSLAVAAADDNMQPGTVSGEEALRLGERMYREGILPSGEPMAAVVMEDIPVDGRMFTCDDCHQRSGLGSVEGTVITWPTNGKELYKPRRRTGAWRPPENEDAKQDARRTLPPYWEIEDARPAYTDETLAQVLWTGVDPAGRKLNPVMPLYHLEDHDMKILVQYLKNLSVEQAPGVDDTTIRFATVVTDGVAEEDRQTMLSTLQAHIDSHNSQSRHQERRAASGPFYKTEMHQAYRRFELDVWELQGPENTWFAQLRDHYQKQPVFALLGGLTPGDWQPIHKFSEQYKIPTIFPLTDFPVISDSDWYTLYFSKGFYQEGEAAARYLNTTENVGPDAKIVAAFRDSRAGRALVQGFARSWKKFGRPEPEYLQLSPETELSGRFWQDIHKSHEPAVLLLWLGADDLAKIGIPGGEEKLPPKIFLSSGLLDYEFHAVPDGLRDTVYLTYPQGLPESMGKRMLAVKRWLQARKVPITDLEMQARIYFLGWMLPGAVKNMRSEFFRDYFLEGFDMMVDQDYAIAVYPRLTFGAGQRYASKGCYIVQLTKGSNPALLKRSDWVIH